MPTPSVAIVDDTCRAACKSMRLLSKQLMILSSSYTRLPFERSGDEIHQVLSVTMSSIQNIQEVLKTAAEKMNEDLQIDQDVQPQFPETVSVTAEEYAFLNAVFQEYTETVVNSSKKYSLFCSGNDICSEARTLTPKPCQDKGEKSKES